MQQEVVKIECHFLSFVFYGNDDSASLDEDNLSDGESILDEVIRNNGESDHH